MRKGAHGPHHAGLLGRLRGLTGSTSDRLQTPGRHRFPGNRLQSPSAGLHLLPHSAFQTRRWDPPPAPPLLLQEWTRDPNQVHPPMPIVLCWCCWANRRSWSKKRSARATALKTKLTQGKPRERQRDQSHGNSRPLRYETQEILFCAEANLSFCPYSRINHEPYHVRRAQD